MIIVRGKLTALTNLELSTKSKVDKIIVIMSATTKYIFCWYPCQCVGERGGEDSKICKEVGNNSTN